jgi:serine/threonine-protein kinase HipA
MRRQGFIYFGKKFAGILEETESGMYVFTYDPVYLAKQKSLPISLTLALRREPYESERLFSFFDGLIPEGWLLNLVTKNWKWDAKDRMGLLLLTCQDCIGAVSVFDTKQSRGHNGK